MDNLCRDCIFHRYRQVNSRLVMHDCLRVADPHTSLVTGETSYTKVLSCEKERRAWTLAEVVFGFLGFRLEPRCGGDAQFYAPYQKKSPEAAPGEDRTPPARKGAKRRGRG